MEPFVDGRFIKEVNIFVGGKEYVCTAFGAYDDYEFDGYDYQFSNPCIDAIEADVYNKRVGDWVEVKDPMNVPGLVKAVERKL